MEYLIATWLHFWWSFMRKSASKSELTSKRCYDYLWTMARRVEFSATMPGKSSDILVCIISTHTSGHWAEHVEIYQEVAAHLRTSTAFYYDFLVCCALSIFVSQILWDNLNHLSDFHATSTFARTVLLIPTAPNKQLLRSRMAWLHAEHTDSVSLSLPMLQYVTCC